MASPTRWTWVWASSGNWWWTGKPGVLRSEWLNWSISGQSIVEAKYFRREWANMVTSPLSSGFIITVWAKATVWDNLLYRLTLTLGKEVYDFSNLVTPFQRDHYKGSIVSLLLFAEKLLDLIFFQHMDL